MLELIYTLTRKIFPLPSIAVRVFYPRISRSRLLSRISRYVVGPFTFTFVVVNGNFHREMWLATSFQTLVKKQGNLTSLVVSIPLFSSEKRFRWKKQIDPLISCLNKELLPVYPGNNFGTFPLVSERAPKLFRRSIEVDNCLHWNCNGLSPNDIIKTPHKETKH